ncbi:MAG TPA: DUF3043 domain-containing protein [Frankiaceae bacterium]|jgi:hypothetical protein|nr:DUF3043 domain-containing protein [Frankiaceae bacterium]
MPSLRKKPAPASAEPDKFDKVNGKGRATPTRKEAQATRRSGPSRPASRPGAKSNDPKSNRKAMSEARRAKAADYRRAMNSGDMSKLPARERVPERIMARDIVDQRKNLGPLLLGVIVVAYFLGLAPVAGLKAVAFYLLPLCLIGIVLDSVLAARKVTRLVHEKYPSTTVKVKGYSGQRALMPARWRQPRPKPGLQIGRWIPRG